MKEKDKLEFNPEIDQDYTQKFSKNINMRKSCDIKELKVTAESSNEENVKTDIKQTGIKIDPKY